MTLPGRSWWGVLVGLAMLAPCQAAEPSPQALEILRRDAQLWDVCFVDAQTGWAVGDRGVIWHTRNGGQSWQQQPSPVTCRLNSVFFLDPQHGWAAGGRTVPFTHVPEGIVLVTRDGGASWQQVPRLLVPTFYRIKFFTSQQGVAFGAPSALFPSGVFTSEDGGRSWTTVPAAEGQTWFAGDFVDPLSGALAGRGAPVTVRRRTLEPARTADLGLRTIHRLELRAPTSGWMVGDGGLVMKTADLGKSWQSTAGELPDDAARHFDLHALAVVQENCWTAGTPGTRIFRTRDGGASWTSHDTGCTAPLHSLAFVDARHGWAVGALGTILATRDGGESWQVQRAGGSRAALLGVFSEAGAVPLELFAHLSGGQGYLSAVKLLGRREFDPQAGVKDDLPQRAHDALVAVGGCGASAAWQFPLRQEGLSLSVDQILTGLDRANDGQALEKLEASIVRAIRLWRPDVLVTHPASLRGEEPFGHLVNQLVLRAVRQAADPTSHVDLATVAGLRPWQVRKVFSTTRAGDTGTLSVNTVQLEPRLGCSVGDRAGAARGLVAESYEPVPVEVGFRLLLDRVPQDRGREDFYSGIAIPPGSDARRMLSETLGESIEQLRRVAQKRRNMQELIRYGAKQDLFLPSVWLGQLGDLTSGLDESSSSQLLYQLAGQYLQRGNWELAAGTYEALVERHPQHPLAHSAQVWLLHYYASGEAAWRVRQSSSAVAQQSTGGFPAQGVVPASAALPMQGRRTAVGSERAQLDERLGKANQIGKELERTRPTLYAEPSIGFPLASAHRKLGYGNEASRFYLSLRRTRTEDAWWDAAQGERWLGERTGLPPKPLWTARAADRKPHLDGALDEAFWRVARPVELKSLIGEDAAWPAVARLAYDGQFLYLGIECRKAPGVEYAASTAPRPRDGDLAQHDRVSVLLDLDRDYTTYYALTVDHRGWTGEACWGDATWNPTWYVAHSSTRESWTAEAAIPLAELTGTRPAAGHVWAAGVQRLVPGVGFQSWTQPAGVKIRPEGFGYLLFE